MALNNTSSAKIQCDLVGIEIFTQDFSSNHRHSTSQDILIPFAVLNGLTALPTFLINLLVMWTVLESRRLRSSNYNILVAILSVSDLLTGLVVQPLFISVCTCYLWDCSYLCELRQVFSTISIVNGRLTIATLAIVCLERYLYIQDALTYSNKVTTRKILITVVISWLMTAIIVAVQTSALEHSLITRSIMNVLFFLPTIPVIIFSSIKLHITVRRQRRRIASQLSSITQPASYQSKLKEFKRSYVMQMALVVFITFQFPAVLARIINTLKGNDHDWTSSFGHWAKPLTATIFYLNSLTNPFLYSIRLTDIRKAVATKIASFNCSKRQVQVVTKQIPHGLNLGNLP